MTDFTPEWRLLTPRADLEALGDYLSVLENQLTDLREQWDVRLGAALAAATAEERDWLYFERRLKDTHVLAPLRGGFIMALWSVYAGGVNEVASHLVSVRGVPDGVEDAKGRDICAKWRNYFSNSLGLELHPTVEDWTSLRVLHAVRNTFAHANGRLSGMSRRVQEILAEGIRRDTGLREGDDGLELDDRYLRASFEMIDDLSRDLVTRALDLDDRSPPPSRGIVLPSEEQPT